MEDTPTPSTAPASPPPAAPSPSSSTSMPSMHVPKGLVDDLKSVLKGDKEAMMRVGKNPAYLGAGVAIFILAQAAMMFSRWRTMQQANDLASSFGLDLQIFTPMDFVLQGIFGIVTGLVLVAVIYLVSTRLLKGKTDLDMKGFATLYFFLMAPGVLMAIPVLGIVGAIWILVLVFMMMMHVFGFTFWKSLGALLLSGLIGGVAIAIVGSVLGIPGYSANFSFNSGY